ncbi:hypothetical protein McpSp1_03190 [Methanocorpusculaceae archaeon Sp1]|nr:hypothetical protein [Methanocorpusculaceae archaeon Sp1]
MRKLFFAAVVCALLIFSAGVAAEEEWIKIVSVPKDYSGAPYIFAGSTNLPPGSTLEFNITSLVNGATESGTVKVRTEEADWISKGTYIWRFQTRLNDFSPGPSTITITAESEHADISDRAEFSLSDIWIKIDPLPFVAAEMENVTFSGTTTIPAGGKLMWEVMYSGATTNGPFYGRSGVVEVQNGTGDVQTWSFTINTKKDMPPLEYIIKLDGVEIDRTTRELFMIYPAGSTTPLPTTPVPIEKYWIKIDPVPFITTDMGNVTFSGTTTIPAGEKLLVMVINTDGVPNGKSEPFGRSEVTIIQNGTAGIQKWNISINATTRLPPKEYVIRVDAFVDDINTRDYFRTYPAGSTTPLPTEAPGFMIIPTLIAGAAAILLTRK